MSQYILRRILQAIPVLFFVSIAVFLMIRLIPGDPAHAILGDQALPDQVKLLNRQMGLDRPLHIQYIVWLGRAVRGDLGESLINDFEVTRMIRLKAPASIQLALASVLVALLIAVPTGTISAFRPRSWFASAISFFNAVFYAVPTFWLAILLGILFGLKLGWLPPSGHVPLTEDPARFFRFLILPALTLGVWLSTVLSRFLRTALLEVLNQDYIRTARAKGLYERVVIFRHALPNAMISMVTVLGLLLASLLGGAVVTEAVFDWPGLGRTLLDAILKRDYTMVQGIVLLMAFFFVVVNLLTDILYAFLDPRIHYQ